MILRKISDKQEKLAKSLNDIRPLFLKFTHILAMKDTKVRGSLYQAMVLLSVTIMYFKARLLATKILYFRMEVRIK